MKISEIFNNFFLKLGSVTDCIAFQDPATDLMEKVIDLHHLICFFIILISVLVSWLLIQIIDNFIYSFKFNPGFTNSSNTKSNLLIYTLGRVQYKTRGFKEDTFLETIWTIAPALILLFISGPSFVLLFLSEEGVETLLTVKAVGFQWYWTYDFTDLFPFWVNNDTALDIDDFVIESYMEPTEYLKEGDLRLLETDNILILPTHLHIRLIITSMDTLHSFAVPALGIKVDAVPGRLNKIDIFIYRMGVFYGQCSEICGIGHGFMPICVFAISYLNFLVGNLECSSILSQLRDEEVCI